MIENRELEAGMKLNARFKKQDYTAEVVSAEQADLKGPTDDGMRIKLADGREFRSVSSAAKAVTGGSINGWRFWSPAGRPADAEAEVPDQDETRRPTGNAAASETPEVSAAPEQPGKPEAAQVGKKPRKTKAKGERSVKGKRTRRSK